LRGVGRAHRRDTAARLVGIGDIGVADWFYSRKAADGTPTLDDAITDYEKGLGKQVRVLREAEPDTLVDASLAAETVVHLVMRTQHLRGVIGSGVTSAFTGVEALFGDPSRLGRMIGVDSPAMASAVGDAIRRSAANLVPAGIPASFSERLFTATIREYGDQLVARIAATFEPLLPGLVGNLADHIRDAHTRLIAKPLSDHGWVAALAGFEWRVMDGEDFILPDAVALSRERDGPLEPLLFTSAVDTKLVVMPVAWNRLLIGRRDNAMLDPTTFNREAATACEQFFIARTPRDTDGLAERIGTGLATRIDSTICEILEDAETVHAISSTNLPPIPPRRVIEAAFSYTVRLADFGDEKLVKAYADLLHSVVGALARNLPLQDFDGTTIAADYHAALAGLDRGDPSLPPVVSAVLSYGVGVAKPVTVLRDGKRKEHLVIAESVAASWLCDDPILRACGLRVLAKMLAGIAHATRYEAALATSFEPDMMTRLLHQCVAAAPSGYWSARYAAFIAPDHAQEDGDAMIEALAHAQREMAIARAAMSGSDDVGAASICAFECASAILTHAADWLGHRDGLAEGQIFAGDDLPARLEPYGLSRWIKLFGRDLAACYRDDGALDFDVTTSLSRHVERLLWALGVYCWPDGDDVRCVVSNQALILPDQLP
jgi:hypothetical protein